ncbi:autophagy protein 18 [Tieghemostelium lacteum]|uniref:Autophagy protein 18 n=1 Tax=Tieghemostelium lacteum TaxID=361077 RepID=A0A151Z758_TIELA|nr:autophagy protein 18 [Tieghemostelium lacteum]|eukprot:KYQ89796.1 autophagy protein 18 [Tieghemostelium lacteum]
MICSGKYKLDLLFVNFNQDFSCIAVGTVDGYKIFNVEPFGLTYSSQSNGGVGIVEMLFSTSLVSTVGSGDNNSTQRKLFINNIKTNMTICDLNFVTAILSVKMNKKRIVVIMETKIHIYDINNMKLLETRETAPNPKGLCALSPSNNNYIVYPASTSNGNILVMDICTLETVNLIQAHKSQISSLAINKDGTLLATASDKGTVIRVYTLPNANKSIQFRRGTTAAIIHSMTFSYDSKFLTVCSDKETIHIFKVDFNDSQNYYSGGSGSGTTNGGNYSPTSSTTMVSKLNSYLPEMFSQVWDPIRDFARIKIPQGIPSICALSQNNKTAMVLTAEGLFLQYHFDEQIGGDLKLAAEHSFMESQNDIVTASLLNNNQPPFQQQPQQQQL